MKTGARRPAWKLLSFGVLLLMISPFVIATVSPTSPALLGDAPSEKSDSSIQAIVDRSMEIDRIEPFCHENDSFKAQDDSKAPTLVELSLDKTVELASRNHLLTRLAREKIGESQGQKWQLASALLPHLWASMFQQRTGRENLSAMGFRNFGMIGPFNTFDARFTLTQKILDLSALSRFQAGRIGVQIARYQEKFARQKVTLLASLAYLEALRSYGEYKAAQADLELAERLLKQAQHQHEVGIATGVDVARAETRLAEEKLRLEKSRTDVHEAYLELQRVTGLSFLSAIRLMNSLHFIQEPLPNAEEAVSAAMNERIEIQIAGDQIRASQFKLYGARAEMLPTFQFSGDYGLSGIKPDRTAREVGAVMFKISMPILEGGKIHGEVEEAASQKKQSEINFDDLKRQIEEDVRLSLWTLETGIEQVKAASKIVSLAQREFELAHHRFNEGVGDNIEVLSAQTTLARAKDTYISALAQYHTARINLSFALGKTESFYLQNTLRKKEA